MNATKPLGADPCDEIETLPLSRGGHGSVFTGQCCIMEKANRLTVCRPDLGKKFGVATRFNDDHPSVDRGIRRFLIRLNDGWLDGAGNPTTFAPKNAQEILNGYAEKVLGTNTGSADAEIRAVMAANWALRVALPVWLDAAKMHAEAEQLRALPEFVTIAAVYGSLSLVRTIRSKAWTRRNEALRRYDAARSDASAVAAAVVVVAVEVEVETVVEAVAKEKLTPVVEEIRRGALNLLDRMIAVGRIEGDGA